MTCTDSTGQTLTALKMSVADLEKKLEQNQCTSGVLSEIAALAGQALQEIRTTSYLLHPPLLDEADFTSAAQWYVDGFAKRSGIKVRLDLATESVSDYRSRLRSPSEVSISFQHHSITAPLDSGLTRRAASFTVAVSPLRGSSFEDAKENMAAELQAHTERILREHPKRSARRLA